MVALEVITIFLWPSLHYIPQRTLSQSVGRSNSQKSSPFAFDFLHGGNNECYLTSLICDADCEDPGACAHVPRCQEVQCQLPRQP